MDIKILLFLFIAGVLTFSCNQEDIENPKKNCPNLLGEWILLAGSFNSPSVLTYQEERNTDTLLNNIEQIKAYIAENYTELINEEFAISFDFRANGEVVLSGNVFYFRCLQEDIFRLSPSSEFDEDVSEYLIIYQSDDVMFTSVAGSNMAWVRG